MKHTPDHRERAYAPRGKLVRGCRVWDRYLLDIAFENLPDDDEAAASAPASAAAAWSGVN